MKSGYYNTPEHRVWATMKQRCLNSNHVAYPRYGGRGIKVDPRWMTFSGFIESMGKRPSDQHQLDRIDNDGPYSPENCRWATRSEQNRNRRDNQWITYNGKTMCARDWSKETGIPEGAIRARIYAGRSVAEILFKGRLPR